jgi:hypothetical protein
MYFEFFFDQTQENFLRGHVRAFDDLGGVARDELIDNLKTAVIERNGDLIRFHPRFLELAAHYHFQPKPCTPYRGSEKGRVERAIRYIRGSFFAARPFTTLADFNRQALEWRDTVAHARPWPQDKRLSVAQALENEKPRLLPLPKHHFDTDLQMPIEPRKKTMYVRFDNNDYSVRPDAVSGPLSLVASDTTVRVVLGTSENVANHRRCYDKGEIIEDPEHKQALLEQKKKALGSTSNARLLSVAPEIEQLLHAAFERGESPAAETRRLLLLLDDHGPEEFAAAVREALEAKTPRASSVAYLLERRRRHRMAKHPMAVDLSRRPDLEDLHVNPHQAETYDDLSHSDDE